MGIADLVIDARSDYKAGYIAYEPDFTLYYKLNKVLIKEGLKLIWQFPNKFEFLWYCIKFTIILAFTED